MNRAQKLDAQAREILELARARGMLPEVSGGTAFGELSSPVLEVLVILQKLAPHAATPMHAMEIALDQLRREAGLPPSNERPRPEKGGALKIKISLAGAKPAIFRRVIVDNDITLGFLHAIIVTVMPWSGDHLHGFDCHGINYGPDEGDKDENTTLLTDLLRKEKSKLKYIYDFGDSWEHTVLLEKIIPAELKTKTMVCLAGKGACPPDECGGLYRYYQCTEAFTNSKHKRHKEAVDVIGEDFDPEIFDLDISNRWLANLGRRRQRAEE